MVTIGDSNGRTSEKKRKNENMEEKKTKEGETPHHNYNYILHLFYL